jgi:hypothetical protein
MYELFGQFYGTMIINAILKKTAIYMPKPIGNTNSYNVMTILEPDEFAGEIIKNIHKNYKKYADYMKDDESQLKYECLILTKTPYDKQKFKEYVFTVFESDPNLSVAESVAESEAESDDDEEEEYLNMTNQEKEQLNNYKNSIIINIIIKEDGYINKRNSGGNALKLHKPRKNSFESKTVKELKSYAINRKIKGYSTMCKSELVQALRKPRKTG